MCLAERASCRSARRRIADASRENRLCGCYIEWLDQPGRGAIKLERSAALAGWATAAEDELRSSVIAVRIQGEGSTGAIWSSRGRHLAVCPTAAEVKRISVAR